MAKKSFFIKSNFGRVCGGGGGVGVGGGGGGRNIVHGKAGEMPPLTNNSCYNNLRK